MTKIYILVAIIVVLVLASYTIFVNSTKNKTKTQLNNTSVETGFLFKQKSFDFGLIKQSGGKVTHDFTFTYIGKIPIKVIAAPASCGCTSATVSPQNLKSGDSGVLRVTFDPNLHAEPQGKFFKTISLVTDPPLKKSPEIKILATINLDLGKQSFESNNSDNKSATVTPSLEYKDINASQLSKMLEHKDFTLIDVHIPLQKHIKGTDLVIPYNEIKQYENKLPQDKNTKIVVYCRGGNMSKKAAQVLEQQGYTNVYNLIGGKRAYDEFLSTK